MRFSSLCVSFVLPVLLSIVAWVAYRYTLRSYPSNAFTMPSPPSISLNSHLYNATIHPHPLLYAAETLVHHPTLPYFLTGCYDGQLLKLEHLSSSTSLTVTPLSYSGFAAHLTPNQTHLCRTPGHHFLCGRPLGLAFRDERTVIVADAYHGLLSYDLVGGRWTSLWNDSHQDTNSVAVTADGDTVYFTSGSALYRNSEVLYVAFAAECSGALLSYSFSTGQARWLLRGLCFGNGVILLDDDRLLVFAESFRARLRALDLTTMTESVAADNLPCLLDNVQHDRERGRYYWVGCGGPLRVAEQTSVFDVMSAWPWLRWMFMVAVPYDALSVMEVPSAAILRMRVGDDGKHELVEWWVDPKGEKLRSTVGAMYNEDDGRLWLSSWKRDWDYLASIPWTPPSPNT